MHQHVLSRLTLVLLLFLLPALAHTAEVYDANNKWIGTVVYHSPYPHWDPYPATVIGKHNGVAYTIRVGRMGMTGSDNLYYSTSTCSGDPIYMMVPSWRTDMLVMPSGVDLQGNLWIVRRATMTPGIAGSYVYAYGDYDSLEPARCYLTWPGDEDRDEWTSPMIKVGNIKQMYKTPYVVK